MVTPSEPSERKVTASSIISEYYVVLLFMVVVMLRSECIVVVNDTTNTKNRPKSVSLAWADSRSRLGTAIGGGKLVIS